MIVLSSSEIKMISHIQREHQGLNLFANIGLRNPYSEELWEKLVETELNIN